MFTVSFTMFILIPYLAPYAVKTVSLLGDEVYVFFGGIATVFTARIFELTDKHI